MFHAADPYDDENAHKHGEKSLNESYDYILIFIILFMNECAMLKPSQWQTDLVELWRDAMVR